MRILEPFQSPQGPFCFSLSAESEGHRAAVRQSPRVASCGCHAMDSTDHDQDWTVCSELQTKGCNPGQVCAVSSAYAENDAAEHDVILDSGADWSCLPIGCAKYGRSVPNLSGLDLSDAQGKGDEGLKASRGA